MNYTAGNALSNSRKQYERDCLLVEHVMPDMVFPFEDDIR